MHVIHTRNVHSALPQGVRYLNECGISEPSRNGDVLVAPEPVTTVYHRPQERVMFWPERDANPFFHFFESLWMLAGRKDANFLNRFIKDFGERYGEADGNIHGAYGARWRDWYDSYAATYTDQLILIIDHLQANPKSRHAVLTMWDITLDLPNGENDHLRDRPCNTQIYFRNLAGRLNMTVLCRSNDMIFGAYGANAVHFSMLQEYMACHLGLEVGTMYQVSNNFHAYPKTFAPVRDLTNVVWPLDPSAYMTDPYTSGLVAPFPLLQSGETMEHWDRDLDVFFHWWEDQGVYHPIYVTQFFIEVVRPLWVAHKCYKEKDYEQADALVDTCAATDWRKACTEWLGRRYA